MRQFLQFLFGFVSFLSFLSFIEMIEFCDAFEGNDYSISYGFQRFRPKDRNLKYIFIENNYWELNFRDNLNEDEMIVEFVSNNSKRADNWFGSNYSMAFCVKTPLRRVENCSTYLLQTSDEHWEYGILDDTENQLIISGQKQRIKVTNRKALKKGTIGFVPILKQSERGLIVLFNQRDGPDYDVYDLKYKDPIQFKFSDWSPEKDYFQSLLNLSKNVETVAIFGEYSGLKARDNNSISHGHGLIIVFKVGKSLKYCWTLEDIISENCKPENQRLLIECIKEVTKTSETPEPTILTTITTTISTTTSTTILTTTEENETELDIQIVILLIVLLIIIILMTIFIVLIAITLEYAKKEPPLKGLQTPKIKSSKSAKQKPKDEEPKQELPLKSEPFNPESDVDYSKPIPLEADSSAADTKSDPNRPTDLIIQQN